MDDRQAGRQPDRLRGTHASCATADRRDDAGDCRRCDSDDDLVNLARRLLKAERTIAGHFPDGRRVNVNWAIVLAAYAVHREKRKLDVSGVCFAVQAPTTTVHRRIERLHDVGLVDRVPDEADRRRTFITLRAEAFGMVEACLRSLAEKRP